MSGATSIQWCHATWNPVRGCSRVSEGCRNCYAERQAARFSDPGQPFNGFASRGVVAISTTNPETVGSRYTRWTGRVELVPDALDWPLHVGRPKWVREAEARGERPRVFVNSMSDLFHGSLSGEAIAAVLGVIAAKPEWDFLVLTKRAAGMREWFAWLDARATRTSELHRYPSRDSHLVKCMLLRIEAMKAGVAPVAMGSSWPLPNLWPMVSVEDQPTADERIPHLLATPAAVRGVSYEPALGPVSFRWAKWHDYATQERERRAAGADVLSEHLDGLRSLDWVIVGGESGPKARPCDIAWARTVREQCREAGVAFFFKQAGTLPIVDAANVGGLRWSQLDATDYGLGDKHVVVRFHHSKGGDLGELPEDLQVRELPEVRR